MISVIFVDGNSPQAKSPLDPFLFMSLPPGVVVQDASLPVLTLLRILHAISRYWGTLYPSISYKPLLSLQVSLLRSLSNTSCKFDYGNLLTLNMFNFSFIRGRAVDL